MFDWFKRTAVPSNEGMSDMTADFASMLEAGRAGFDMATDTLLGGKDPESVREDLFATDKQINEWEMRIRRHLVVHASLHGMTAMPACLVLMAIVKDAERIGDYAKNLFDLTPRSQALKADESDHRELSQLRDQLSSALAATRRTALATTAPRTRAASSASAGATVCGAIASRLPRTASAYLL